MTTFDACRRRRSRRVSARGSGSRGYLATLCCSGTGQTVFVHGCPTTQTRSFADFHFDTGVGYDGIRHEGHLVHA